MEEDSAATSSLIGTAIIPLGFPQTDDTPSPEKTPQTQPPSNPRRLPPPCWSQDETVALIESYRDKWYALRRGNLKAPHWQEVADAVARHCPGATPPKTAVQCRHKMEKLRKRYRAELQRSRSLPVSRFISSWVHFKHMDAMEKGPNGTKADSDENNDELDDEDDDDELFEGIAPNSRSIHGLYGNGVGGLVTLGTAKSSGIGVRIKIPTAVSIAQPGVNYRKIGNNFSSGATLNAHPSAKYGKFGGGKGIYVAQVKAEAVKMGKRERDPVEEMVGAIKGLGDGFVRMERMKMEMAREIESMRMEMEMKRTEMILESQQRILEAFARAVSDKKKKKKKMKRMADAEDD